MPFVTDFQIIVLFLKAEKANQGWQARHEQAMADSRHALDVLREQLLRKGAAEELLVADLRESRAELRSCRQETDDVRRRVVELERKLVESDQVW